MDWNLVFFAVAALGVGGLLMGVMLALASIKFHVVEDPLVERVREVLPGSNCGACGLPGCDAAARAIVERSVAVDVCVSGGGGVTRAVAAALGVEAGPLREPQVTLVRCRGGRGTAATRFRYQGVSTCRAANLTAGGQLACPYGCLGFGDCERSCPFEAISMGGDGLPHVDLETCTRCGICVGTCPRQIIAFLPATAEVAVACVSRDRGKAVRQACPAGCIACGACVRVCEPGAITLDDNLAIIDYALCTSCGACVEKCPTGCILWLQGAPVATAGEP